MAAFQVLGWAASQRPQWPERVMLVGWAADPHVPRDYRGFYWQNMAIYNPVELLSNYIQTPITFHNLATLMPKDPMVELLPACMYKLSERVTVNDKSYRLAISVM